jgi:hypothetical protein
MIRVRTLLTLSLCLWDDDNKDIVLVYQYAPMKRQGKFKTQLGFFPLVDKRWRYLSYYCTLLLLLISL